MANNMQLVHPRGFSLYQNLDQNYSLAEYFFFVCLCSSVLNTLHAESTSEALTGMKSRHSNLLLNSHSSVGSHIRRQNCFLTGQSNEYASWHSYTFLYSNIGFTLMLSNVMVTLIETFELVLMKAQSFQLRDQRESSLIDHWQAHWQPQFHRFIKR